jgi:hypothetical protein
MTNRVLFFTTLVFISFLALEAQQTEIIYLSGTGSDHTVNWNFFCTGGRNSGSWTTIPVPSCWETEGFGAYNYGYDKMKGRANEKGLYKYSFRVPSSWKGRHVNIVFEGSMTDTEVKINGKQAGSKHQGAFYRFRYDIGNLLNYGTTNLLEVTVSKVSSDESVNMAERKADYWVFGGIFRPVYLESMPKSHIERLALDADANGDFTANVVLSGSRKQQLLSAKIFDVSGRLVTNEFQVATNGKSQVSLTAKVDNPHLWNTELPYLYRVVFNLMQNGEIIHSVTKKIGFRTIELRERDGIYLNGVKIKFKGVNRHSFYPTTGRTLSNALILEDVNLIKDMNMNAVRNSHYPADEFFYQACDSLGIMVLDELGGWHDAYDTEVGSKLVREMMYKSMNHPCVVMWVNGNEGGHNPELLHWFDEIDIQKRPVLQAWQNFRGIDTQHYRDYNYGVGSHYQGHNVVMPTEFLHGMYDGGQGSGLEDFWELMLHNPLSAGGFLWDFADEAVVRTDKDGQLDSDGNHGADGIVGPYHEKEGSFFTIKEVWAPIFFEHKEITKAFDGMFDLENRYHFTNLNQCSFHWKLSKVAIPGTDIQAKNISGNAVSPDVPAGDKGKLKLQLPENWQQFDILYITAEDAQNREIFTWSWPISLPDNIANELVDKNGNNQISVKENDSLLSVEVNDLVIAFSKNTGLLSGVRNARGPISLSNGPVLCEGETIFKDLIYHRDGECLIVESEFDEKSVMKECKWTIYPSAWIRLDIVYSPEVERHELMGISFDYPESLVKSIEWMGDGPYRVWKNRMKGNQLGVWKKDYNNTITGQSGYIYPEFKGYHSRMYWLTMLTREQPFTVVCLDEDLFFRMYTPGTPKEPYNTAPLFPSGDISFLQGITPMGTKCLQTYRMGPMSDKNIYYSYGGARPKKMVLYFNFWK